MQHFNKILVGVDLSHADRLATEELNDATRVAVERAIEFASHVRAELTLIAVLDISEQAIELLEEDSERPVHHNVEDAANEVLAELVQKAADAGVTAKAHLAVGTAWVELIQQVLRDKHDLLIVGTRDLNRAQRILFGSTAMKLIRKCPCPVWVTRPDPTPETINILVPSDFSEVSQQALHLAVNAAQMEHANVHLLHVIEKHLERRLSHMGVNPEKIAAYRSQVEEDAEAKLHEQLSHTDHRTLDQPVQVHVKNGPADVVILDAIEELNIDLLILGTVARGGVAGMIIGNTAEHLLPQIPCSLLAIKPEGFKSPIQLDT